MNHMGATAAGFVGTGGKTRVKRNVDVDVIALYLLDGRRPGGLELEVGHTVPPHRSPRVPDLGRQGQGVDSAVSMHHVHGIHSIRIHSTRIGESSRTLNGRWSLSSWMISPISPTRSAEYVLTTPGASRTRSPTAGLPCASSLVVPAAA